MTIRLLAFTLLLCMRASSQGGESLDRNRHVIVISLDGFPAYALEDPKLPIPTLRQLMKTGSWTKRMSTVNPTVTWPNHTTMVTGLFPRDHGLLFNGTLVRTENPLTVKVDPNVDKSRMVHAPTLYDEAFGKKLTTAQVDWVAINNAETINWAFPERAKASDPLVAEMIHKGLLTADEVGNEGHPSILWRDQIWTRAGAYIIREKKPNLLLLHLLALDSTHHNYGPRTLAANDAMAFLDGCVRQLIEATQQAGISDQTTLVVVSDHGFKTVEKRIRLKSLLIHAQLSSGVQAVPEGGSAMLYIKKSREKDLTAKLQALFNGTDGVARVATPSEYDALGLPQPAHDPQSPNLVVFAKPGYDFSGGDADDPVMMPMKPTVGSHGYLNTDSEMDAIFIAVGKGIRRGVVLDRIANLRVAPTLAQLLGIRLPRAEGTALTEILQ